MASGIILSRVQSILGQTLVESLARHAAERLSARAQPFTMDKTLNAWTSSLTLTGSSQVEDGPSSILFVKSKYLMNLSGGTALQLTRRYPDLLRSKRLLVLHDELSLAPGKCKSQFGGAAKGHNGIRDITAKLKRDDFHRFKIGIGRPESDAMGIAAWCLSPAMRDELQLCAEDGATTGAAWNYLEQMIVGKVETI